MTREEQKLDEKDLQAIAKVERHLVYNIQLLNQADKKNMQDMDVLRA